MYNLFSRFSHTSRQISINFSRNRTERRDFLVDEIFLFLSKTPQREKNEKAQNDQKHVRSREWTWANWLSLSAPCCACVAPTAGPSSLSSPFTKEA
jgi:hypothetical protein